MNARLLLAAGLACCATPALAHAFLNHANPGAGATLANPPKAVVLVFSEELEPAFSGVSITDATGRSVEAASPAISGNTIVARLQSLAPGTYRVTWHAVSVDTHRTEGGYRFAVKR